MKVKSLNTIYHKLHKHILLAQAFTEVKELSFIIKSCRLKPSDYVFNKKYYSPVKLYDKWFDEFGNTLNIKSKDISITFNDLSLNRDKIICTDLYYGLSIDKIMKISKFAYFVTERDDDQEYYIITFLGIDDYLRSYLYFDGELSCVSPLILGLDDLKFMYGEIDIDNFIKIENEIGSGISRRAWLSSMPLGSEFLEQLNKCDDTILNIIKGTEIK